MYPLTRSILFFLVTFDLFLFITSQDWHFVRDFPAYKAYSTLQYFASDWLNEFWHVRSDIHDDYQFVYMGPKGSW